MFKDLVQLTKTFSRTYWLPATAWMILQILILSYYRHLTIVTSIAEPIRSTPSNGIIFVLAGLISLSFMVLLIFLGNLFSSRQRGAWLRQLPFGSFALNIFPLAIVFVYGFCLLMFIPWGAFSSGVSVFAIGIPIAVFLVLKNSPNYIIGLFKAAATGVILILMWLYLFYDWSAHQTQFTVEAIAIVVFCLIWQILGRQERIYTLLTTAASILLLLSITLYHQTRTPENFSEAVIDHAFLPTQKTRDWFQRIALEPSYWESVDQFSLPSFVRYRSQDFAEGLSTSEKIRFIENVESNRMKWKDAKLPEYRPLRFASFLQPEIRFKNYSLFPIGKNNLNQEIEDYLYKNWKDSRLFCQLLPPRRTAAYLDKMFHNDECYAELFNQSAWSFYSFFEHGEYEEAFDADLLDAYSKSPAKTRNYLMTYMNGGWGLNELKEKYDDLRYVVFAQKPLTKELLDQMRSDRFRSSLKKLKEMSADRETFLSEVRKASALDQDSKLPVLFLCQYLFNDCNTFLNAKKSAAISLPQAWKERIHSLSLDDTGIWLSWIIDELEKEENWPKLLKLIEYAKARTDL